MLNNVKQLLKNLILPLVVGLVAAFLTRDAMEIFGMLNKPPLAPPAWLFPVVWTILYLLMGVSSYLISEQGREREDVQNALATYEFQLFFNFVWSILFFNFGWYLISFLWLIGLWILIVKMIVEYYPIQKTAAILMIPYLLWVTFAGYLNLWIYLNN